MTTGKLTSPEILERWRKNRPKEPFPIIALLDNIRSTYNVGSIFRTACSAYIQKLILCGITAKPPHPGIEKTALGTTTLIPWEYEENALDALSKLKKKGYKIASLELTPKSIPVQTVKMEDFPLVLVIGNEVDGVSDEILRRSDLFLEVSLYGEKESLNVAVAFGIAIFFLIERFQVLKASSKP